MGVLVQEKDERTDEISDPEPMPHQTKNQRTGNWKI